MYLYKKEMQSRFKFPFMGISDIETSYSQLLQDMWVLAVTNGEHYGTFVEIGADQPKFINNTYLLESNFGWSGISVDISSQSKYAFEQSNRSSKFILGDATTLDYRKIFDETFSTTDLSYLQVDVEPNTNSLLALKQIPFDKYRFKCCTLEHDHYDTSMTKESNDNVREETRDIMDKNGYVLVSGNLSNLDYEHEMEDWFINKEMFTLQWILKFMRYEDEVMPAHVYMGLG